MRAVLVYPLGHGNELVECVDVRQRHCQSRWVEGDDRVDLVLASAPAP
jgi:hypothetical protein